MVTDNLNRGSILELRYLEAASKLEKLGYKIAKTAGFYFPSRYNSLKGANHTHSANFTNLNGKFTSEELRAMADYMDAAKEYNNGRG